MAKKEPTPVEMYQSHLEQVTGNVKTLKKEHDVAIVKAYGAIASDFEKVDRDDHNKVYALLAKAAVAYKKGTKIPAAGADDAFEIGDVISTLKQLRMSIPDVVKKFQAGEGEEVLRKMMNAYHNQNISNRHSTWYLKNVGADFDKRSKLASGYKAHHKSSDHVAQIAEGLEGKVLDKAYQSLQD
ncbi:TPA: hypothetical protein HA265_02860 [Candidatus Woesearchaeota archaeon]|nr:hypothetical protein [Candidatus Woesearchaeota archaeon]